MMNKTSRFLNLKFIALFSITLLIGLFAGLSERYVFSVSLVENFTQSQAEALTGKRVREKCFEQQRNKIKVGKTIGVLTTEFGVNQIKVKWKNEKWEWTAYPKSYFERCIEITE